MYCGSLRQTTCALWFSKADLTCMAFFAADNCYLPLRYTTSKILLLLKVLAIYSDPRLISRFILNIHLTTSPSPEHIVDVT